MRFLPSSAAQVSGVLFFAILTLGEINLDQLLWLYYVQNLQHESLVVTHCLSVEQILGRRARSGNVQMPAQAKCYRCKAESITGGL